MRSLPHQCSVVVVPFISIYCIFQSSPLGRNQSISFFRDSLAHFYECTMEQCVCRTTCRALSSHPKELQKNCIRHYYPEEGGFLQNPLFFLPLFSSLSCSGKSNDFERSKMERNQIAGCSVSRFFCTNTIFCKSKLASSMTAADNLNSQDLAKKVVKKCWKLKWKVVNWKFQKKVLFFTRKI